MICLVSPEGGSAWVNIDHIVKIVDLQNDRCEVHLSSGFSVLANEKAHQLASEIVSIHQGRRGL